MSSEKNYLNDNYKSFFEDSLSKKDPELYKAIKDELIRQQQHIELIASENIAVSYTHLTLPTTPYV